MRGVVAAELLKLRTTRLWWGLLLGTLALAALNVFFTALSAGQSFGPGIPSLPPLTDIAGIQAAYGSGYQSGYLMVAVLGTIVGATDFRHRTATQTFLATPARGRVVVAKMLVAALAGVVYGLVVQAASVLITWPFALDAGASLRLGEADVVRALALGVLGIAVWAVIGTALGVLLRNQVAAVMAVVGVVFLLDALLGLALGQLGLDAAVKFLPGNASSAVTGAFTGFDLLAWWAGLLTLLGYGIAFAFIGYGVSLRRDVH